MKNDMEFAEKQSCLLKGINTDLKSLLRNCRSEAACGIKWNLQKTVLQRGDWWKRRQPQTKIFRSHGTTCQTWKLKRKKYCAFSKPSILVLIVHMLPS